MNLYRGSAAVVSKEVIPDDELPKGKLGFQPPKDAVVVKEVRRMDPERERALRGA